MDLTKTSSPSDEGRRCAISSDLVSGPRNSTQQSIPPLPCSDGYNTEKPIAESRRTFFVDLDQVNPPVQEEGLHGSSGGSPRPSSSSSLPFPPFYTGGDEESGVTQRRCVTQVLTTSKEDCTGSFRSSLGTTFDSPPFSNKVNHSKEMAAEIPHMQNRRSRPTSAQSPPSEASSLSALHQGGDALPPSLPPSRATSRPSSLPRANPPLSPDLDDSRERASTPGLSPSPSIPSLFITSPSFNHISYVCVSEESSGGQQAPAKPGSETLQTTEQAKGERSSPSTTNDEESSEGSLSLQHNREGATYEASERLDDLQEEKEALDERRATSRMLSQPRWPMVVETRSAERVLPSFRRDAISGELPFVDSGSASQESEVKRQQHESENFIKRERRSSSSQEENERPSIDNKIFSHPIRHNSVRRRRAGEESVLPPSDTKKPEISSSSCDRFLYGLSGNNSSVHYPSGVVIDQPESDTGGSKGGARRARSSVSSAEFSSPPASPPFTSSVRSFSSSEEAEDPLLPSAVSAASSRSSASSNHSSLSGRDTPTTSSLDWPDNKRRKKTHEPSRFSGLPLPSQLIEGELSSRISPRGRNVVLGAGNDSRKEEEDSVRQNHENPLTTPPYERFSTIIGVPSPHPPLMRRPGGGARAAVVVVGAGAAAPGGSLASEGEFVDVAGEGVRTLGDKSEGGGGTTRSHASRSRSSPNNKHHPCLAERFAHQQSKQQPRLDTEALAARAGIRLSRLASRQPSSVSRGLPASKGSDVNASKRRFLSENYLRSGGDDSAAGGGTILLPSRGGVHTPGILASHHHAHHHHQEEEDGLRTAAASAFPHPPWKQGGITEREGGGDHLYLSSSCSRASSSDRSDTTRASWLDWRQSPQHALLGPRSEGDFYRQAFAAGVATASVRRLALLTPEILVSNTLHYWKEEEQEEDRLRSTSLDRSPPPSQKVTRGNNIKPSIGMSREKEEQPEIPMGGGFDQREKTKQLAPSSTCVSGVKGRRCGETDVDVKEDTSSSLVLRTKDDETRQESSSISGGLVVANSLHTAEVSGKTKKSIGGNLQNGDFTSGPAGFSHVSRDDLTPMQSPSEETPDKERPLRKKKIFLERSKEGGGDRISGACMRITLFASRQVVRWHHLRQAIRLFPRADALHCRTLSPSFAHRSLPSSYHHRHRPPSCFSLSSSSSVVSQSRGKGRSLVGRSRRPSGEEKTKSLTDREGEREEEQDFRSIRLKDLLGEYDTGDDESSQKNKGWTSRLSQYSEASRRGSHRGKEEEEETRCRRSPRTARRSSTPVAPLSSHTDDEIFSQYNTTTSSSRTPSEFSFAGGWETPGGGEAYHSCLRESARYHQASSSFSSSSTPPSGGRSNKRRKPLVSQSRRDSPRSSDVPPRPTTLLRGGTEEVFSSSAGGASQLQSRRKTTGKAKQHGEEEEDWSLLGVCQAGSHCSPPPSQSEDLSKYLSQHAHLLAEYYPSLAHVSSSSSYPFDSWSSSSFSSSRPLASLSQLQQQAQQRTDEGIEGETATATLGAEGVGGKRPLRPSSPRGRGGAALGGRRRKKGLTLEPENDGEVEGEEGRKGNRSPVTRKGGAKGQGRGRGKEQTGNRGISAVVDDDHLPERDMRMRSTTGYPLDSSLRARQSNRSSSSSSHRIAFVPFTPNILPGGVSRQHRGGGTHKPERRAVVEDDVQPLRDPSRTAQLGMTVGQEENANIKDISSSPNDDASAREGEVKESEENTRGGRTLRCQGKDAGEGNEEEEGKQQQQQLPGEGGEHEESLHTKKSNMIRPSQEGGEARKFHSNPAGDSFSPVFPCFSSSSSSRASNVMERRRRSSTGCLLAGEKFLEEVERCGVVYILHRRSSSRSLRREGVTKEAAGQEEVFLSPSEDEERKRRGDDSVMKDLRGEDQERSHAQENLPGREPRHLGGGV